MSASLDSVLLLNQMSQFRNTADPPSDELERRQALRHHRLAPRLTLLSDQQQRVAGSDRHGQDNGRPSADCEKRFPLWLIRELWMVKSQNHWAALTESAGAMGKVGNRPARAAGYRRAMTGRDLQAKAFLACENGESAIRGIDSFPDGPNQPT